MPEIPPQVIGLVIALVIGYFGGLNSLITLALIFLCYWIGSKVVKPASKPMLPAFAILGTLVLWSSFSLVYRYINGQLDMMWLSGLLLDIIPISVGLIWLITRPGTAPVILLTLWQGMDNIGYLDFLITAVVGGSSSVPMLDFRMLLLQLLLGIAAILFMFHGLKTIKPTGKSWYLLPIVLNIIGGIAGYLTIKDKDEKLAKNLLYTGLGLFFVFAVIFYLAYPYTPFISIGKTELDVQAPTLVEMNQEFKITVTIKNNGTETRELTRIALPDAYLEGISIVSSFPQYEKYKEVTQLYPEQYYHYSINIPAKSEQIITFNAKAIKAGNFSGYIWVDAYPDESTIEFRTIVNDL